MTNPKSFPGLHIPPYTLSSFCIAFLFANVYTDYGSAGSAQERNNDALENDHWPKSEESGDAGLSYFQSSKKEDENLLERKPSYGGSPKRSNDDLEVKNKDQFNSQENRDSPAEVKAILIREKTRRGILSSEEMR